MVWLRKHPKNVRPRDRRLKQLFTSLAPRHAPPVADDPHPHWTVLPLEHDPAEPPFGPRFRELDAWLPGVPPPVDLLVGPQVLRDPPPRHHLRRQPREPLHPALDRLLRLLLHRVQERVEGVEPHQLQQFLPPAPLAEPQPPQLLRLKRDRLAVAREPPLGAELPP